MGGEAGSDECQRHKLPSEQPTNTHKTSTGTIRIPDSPIVIIPFFHFSSLFSCIVSRASHSRHSLFPHSFSISSSTRLYFTSLFPVYPIHFSFLILSRVHQFHPFTHQSLLSTFYTSSFIPPFLRSLQYPIQSLLFPSTSVIHLFSSLHYLIHLFSAIIQYPLTYSPLLSPFLLFVLSSSLYSSCLRADTLIPDVTTGKYSAAPIWKYF